MAADSTPVLKGYLVDLQPYCANFACIVAHRFQMAGSAVRVDCQFIETIGFK